MDDGRMTTTTNTKLYDRLQSDTGVDFLALRQKYAGQQQQGTGLKGGVEVDISKAQEVRKANEQLDKYKICRTCNGQGFVKVTYNHQVKESNCPECEGEQFTFTQVAKDAATRALAER
jgi:DnaJ-class molecular chaperone